MEIITTSEGPVAAMSLTEACQRIASVYPEDPNRTLGDVFDRTYQMAISDPAFRDQANIPPASSELAADNGSSSEALGDDGMGHDASTSSGDGPPASFDDVDTGTSEFD